MSVLTEGGISSPFTPFTSAPAVPGEQGPSEHEQWLRESGPLESPFERGVLVGRDESEQLAETAAELLTELEDEDFADALEALVEEAASRHAADVVSWSAVPTPEQARSLLEAWIEPLRTETERGLDALGQRLAGVDLATLSEAEADRLAEGLDVRLPEGNEVFEQFFGSFFKKAFDTVKRVAKKAVSVVGKVLPIGAILDKIKQFLMPMIQGVLDAGIARLPQAVQPIARTLAQRLGLRSAGELPTAGEGMELPTDGARLAEQFDLGVASLLLAPDPEAFEAETDTPFGRESGLERPDAVAELDRARARFAEQLVELPPDANPSREIENFLPAIMAAKPFIKIGIGLIGRDRVVNFIAERIAGLMKGLIGADAARQLAVPLVDVGLRALDLEVPAATEIVGAEALASTVEGTMERLLELPGEAFADPLRLDAAVQSAFAEAASAYLPGQSLHPDLPERETSNDEAWVLVPPAARPAYRCRRYGKIFRVDLRRPVARAIPWSDGGTLESYLRDQGARRWPVRVDVHLYEALPGSRPGHFVPRLDGESAAESADEFQPLTPEVAGLLVGEPGLGRRVALPPSARARRYFRVRAVELPGRRLRRPRRRVLVRFDLASASPSVTVVLRLAEAPAQQLLAKLEPGQGRRMDLRAVLSDLQAHYAAALPAVVVRRLLRSGLVPGAGEAGLVAEQAANAVSAALSAFLTERAQQLAGAARNPADGLTITITFPGVTRQLLTRTPPAAWPAGRVSVTPGWGRV